MTSATITHVTIIHMTIVRMPIVRLTVVRMCMKECGSFMCIEFFRFMGVNEEGEKVGTHGTDAAVSVVTVETN